MLSSPRFAPLGKFWLLPVSTLLLVTISCEKAAELSTPAIAADHVYTQVEQMPKYKGGWHRLVKDLFWGVYYEYPAIAKAANLEGDVLVKFTVAMDGTVQDVQLQKGIAPSWPQQQGAAHALEALAMKAVRKLPGQWTPGSQGGKQVAVSYTVPFKFANGKLSRRKQTGGPVEVEPISEYQIYAPDSQATAFGRFPIFKDDNPVRPSPNSHNVYSTVEEMPEYAGGQGQLLADLIRRLQYPTSAKAAKLDGVAFVKFVVAEDGSVKDVALEKGILAPKGLEAVAEEMNQAALATLHNLPRQWKPGIQGGKEVAVSYSVPITFFLN
ncbi:energy transducer TonB [Hymenobacter volaticus]|uniref:Energy transducer TonB n=1 Tax=Hymenobacter volaticus TaxID=2932254 RepID=A0ABY4G6N4_9BACT|nr:energy transducer TonB [Hymenobacter volaticus]UOQ66569.1 energy transducer TonB [Hymenobacter volaticus]